MLWFRDSRPRIPAGPLAVPDTRFVLRAALMASWSRDRRVGGRRLLWRWTLFYCGKYWYVLALLAACVGGGLWWRYGDGWLAPVPTDPLPGEFRATTAPEPPAPQAPTDAQAGRAAPDAAAAVTGEPLQLTLDAHFTQPDPYRLPPAAAPMMALEPQTPLFIRPDDALHSKEP